MNIILNKKNVLFDDCDYDYKIKLLYQSLNKLVKTNLMNKNLTLIEYNHNNEDDKTLASDNCSD